MSIKERVAKCMENVKTFTDKYGRVWCEVNGKKFPKKQLEYQLAEKFKEEDELEHLKNVCNFLPF